MACETNERSVDLHQSIVLKTPVHNWDLSNSLLISEDSCKVPDKDCEIEDDREVPVTSIVMPSSDVVEISQVFYFPLYTAPIDWIYQQHLAAEFNETEREAIAFRVAKELQSLSFFQSQNNPDASDDNNNDNVLSTLTKALQDKREDWFSELSGGQKSKVELVRKIFLRDACPNVLLIGKNFSTYIIVYFFTF